MKVSLNHLVDVFENGINKKKSRTTINQGGGLCFQFKYIGFWFFFSLSLTLTHSSYIHILWFQRFIHLIKYLQKLLLDFMFRSFEDQRLPKLVCFGRNTFSYHYFNSFFIYQLEQQFSFHYIIYISLNVCLQLKNVIILCQNKRIEFLSHFYLGI